MLSRISRPLRSGLILRTVKSGLKHRSLSKIIGVDKITGGHLDHLKNVREEAPISPDTGHNVLYRGRHERSILIMLGVSFFNFIYWSYQLTFYYAYHGNIVNGVDIGGDIRWPILGAVGTFIMGACTRMYSRNCIRSAYLTEDGKRLGFQVHTIFGVAGPKFEASLNNCTLASDKQQKIAMRQLIPVQLEGLGRNLLLDGDGIYYDNGKLIKLLEANKLKTQDPFAYAKEQKEARKKQFGGDKNK